MKSESERNSSGEEREEEGKEWGKRSGGIGVGEKEWGEGVTQRGEGGGGDSEGVSSAEDRMYIVHFSTAAELKRLRHLCSLISGLISGIRCGYMWQVDQSKGSLTTCSTTMLTDLHHISCKNVIKPSV